MATIYARWIKVGKMTLDDVPERWRGQVDAMIEEEKRHGIEL